MTKPTSKTRNTITKKPAAKKQPVPISGYKKLVSSARFAKIYAILSVAILLGTTFIWALLGARLQAGNADQLANSYLFESSAVFHGALLPGQHSFLVKWPLFFFVKLFGNSPTTFTIFTVGTVLITVSLLAAILYRIERRHFVFGTLCLALASVLLLVPAVPYAGGILPVNMAMLTTRNLEYLLYVASLGLLVWSPRMKSWKFWAGVSLLVLLIASDKLFLTLSIGGAIIALLLYAFSKGWNLVSLSANWLAATFVSALGAISLLWLINAVRITHISSQAGAGPYSLASGPRDLVLGAIYAVTGVLTNFGANPAFDALKTRDIFHQALHRLVSLGGPGFIINAVILAGGVFAAWQLVRASLAHNKNKDSELDRPARLSIMLICSAIAGGGAFVVTNHYYAVDARYLTIAVFAVFIAAAAYLRGKTWKPERLAIAGLVITAGILLSLTTVARTYTSDRDALATINQRNSLVAQALTQHPVTTLVGDYWRVLPIKLDAKNNLPVMPLSGCTQPRGILSSKVWQPDITHKSFAYLLSLDEHLTDYPNCSINDIIGAYGQPNASITIAGTLNNPKELLFFYDHGVNHSAPAVKTVIPSTVLPISLDELPNTSCPGPTTMNIVAHQDDDLLFMNPSLIHDIQKGYCIRTIYVTAGDAGSSQFYWLSREHGSEAAYDYMDGPGADVWVQRIVKLGNNQYVSVANPRGNSKISLIFLHLPDGNTNGGGFQDTHFESLAKLDNGKISIMRTVDNQSAYTSPTLVQAIASLMDVYKPTEIRTQANYVSKEYPDHSDHMAVGRFVKRAYSRYEQKQYDNRIAIPLNFYTGYPIRAFLENVSGADLEQKEKAFFAYAQFDREVCGSLQQCSHTTTYSAYLKRQYQNPY